MRLCRKRHCVAPCPACCLPQHLLSPNTVLPETHALRTGDMDSPMDRIKAQVWVLPKVFQTKPNRFVRVVGHCEAPLKAMPAFGHCHITAWYRTCATAGICQNSRLTDLEC